MAPTVTAAPQWVLHPNHAPEAAGSIARSLGAPLALGHALVNRGVGGTEAARRFLDPVLEDLHEPGRMLDLERAVTSAPESYDAWLGVADTRSRLGDAAGAEEALRRAEALPGASDGRAASLRARIVQRLNP